MILTLDNGVPFNRPERKDFTTDIDFIRAFYDYRDAIAREINQVFATAFVKAMRGGW